ncbi:predicted protein [Chaetoceros tenuissimus]|uniref:Uncharacterized protein n=1 Tax=Chaetoceros tenuissimus TaxID=426638 RepID=A0AAD3D266_9STRA|nr:predicted protein [Chaetoceros tenuissimus]
MVVNPSLVAKVIASSASFPTTLANIATQETSSQMVALAVRGGGEALVNLTRAKFRTEALSGYGVVSALLFSQSMSMFNSIPKKMQDDDGENHWVEDSATVLLAVTSLVSVIACLTTTFIFALCGMYTRNAVGMGNDLGYINFIEQTANIRKIGFKAMLISQYSMQSSFVVSIFLKFKGKLRMLLGPIALIFSLWSMSVWGPIFRIAAETLF